MYGEPETLPAIESYPAMPLSQYGASKYSIENYLKIYNRLYNIGYSILRLPNVYGPNQDPHGEAGVVAIFIKVYYQTIIFKYMVMEKIKETTFILTM